MMHEKYIVEFRDSGGQLLPISVQEEIEDKHPFLASKSTFTIDDLCHWASYGEGRNNPVGPMEYIGVIKKIDPRISIRKKTW